MPKQQAVDVRSFRRMLAGMFGKLGLKKYVEMSRVSGITSVYLSQIMNGKRPPPSDEIIVAACEKMKLDHDAMKRLLFAAARDRATGCALKAWDSIHDDIELTPETAGLGPQMKLIPVFDDFRTGLDDSDFTDSAIDTIAVSEKIDATGLFAGIVKGDSMAPDIPSGSCAIIRRIEPNETLPDGTICAVHAKDWKDAALKQVYHDPSGLVILRSINPVFPPITSKSVEIIGVLVESRRKW